MSTLRAYYDGSAFVPIEPIHMSKGKVVTLAVLQDEPMNDKSVERLAAFKRLTNEIREINRTEPLPPEYDEIMMNRVNFARELDL